MVKMIHSILPLIGGYLGQKETILIRNDDIGYKEYFSSKEELLEDVDWTLVAKVMKLALKTSANPELIEKIRVQANYSEDK